MLPREQLDLQTTLPRYFEKLQFPFVIVNYDEESTSAVGKAEILARNRTRILKLATVNGVLNVVESRHLESVDIFPIISVTGRMYGRINKWGHKDTDIMVSYPGINGITEAEKLLILELINNEPYISTEPRKPLLRKNLVFGERSGIDIAETGLQPGYIGPLFNYNATILPISLERAFWDDHTHRPNVSALYELALNNMTGIIIKPAAYRAIRKNFFPQRQIYSILSDEVGVPAPKNLDEG